MKAKYRIIQKTFGNNKQHFYVQHKKLGIWWDETDCFNIRFTFDSFKEAEQHVYSLAKPETVVVKEYPEQCVVSLDFDNNSFKLIQKECTKRNITIDEVVSELLQNYLSKKKQKKLTKNENGLI